MTRPFLDANVLLRHLLQDDPEQSPQATAFLDRVEADETRVRMSVIAVFEVVYALQGLYELPKATVREVVLPLLELPGIVLPGKGRIVQAFDLYVERDLPFATAYQIVEMAHADVHEIVSFDPTFDTSEGVRRVQL
jgi:predicted nucleic-acid-binding protein